MTIQHHQLPDSVERYLTASLAERAALVSSTFAENATVHDEGNTYVGIDAIQQWSNEVANRLTLTSTIDDIVQDSNRVTAQVTYTGDFPGSPVQLYNHFTIDEGLIIELDIRP